MKIKIALIVSAFLTVILLTVVGSVVAATSQKNVSATATASQSVSMNATKEAAYLQLIAQANQTIDQANQEITALTAQSQGQTNPTASPYPILADQAAAIASKTTGETPTKTPELVNFSGKVAYEVTFRNGKCPYHLSLSSVS